MVRVASHFTTSEVDKTRLENIVESMADAAIVFVPRQKPNPETLELSQEFFFVIVLLQKASCESCFSTVQT
eukprot:710012-Amphidinium_carterae.1